MKKILLSVEVPDDFEVNEISAILYSNYSYNAGTSIIRLPTDAEIEIKCEENLKKQLPDADIRLITLLNRLQTDGAKWLKSKIEQG